MLVMNWAAKALHIFISVLLCVSLFATGLMAAPDCGARCCCSAASQMSTHHAMPMKIQSSKGCCSGNAPMPCDIQNAQPHELPDALLAASPNINVPAMDLLVDHDAVEPDASASVTASFSDNIYQHFRSPPLYLTNLAILI
jgi:hypothetical protein